MSLFYVDTSAAVKLLREEDDSTALASLFDREVGASWISSVLLRVELVRATRRVLPELIDDAHRLLASFDFLAIDDDLVDAAMAEEDPSLRSLDAIHLASARLLGPALDGLVTYDRKLGAAARAAGFTVVSPRDQDA